jgi:endothelin-converting enzyme/putative endopeptidase
VTLRHLQLLIPLLLASCASSPPPPTTPAKSEAAAKAADAVVRPMPSGLDAAALDTSVKPCEDFYQYACGGWLAANPIPADRSLWGTTAVLAERNQDILREILEATASGHPPEGTPYAKQLGDYYATCMDEAKLETVMPEVKARLARLQKVSGGKALATEVARLQREGADVVFQYESIVDAKKSTDVIGVVRQGGLGLPDRDYYVSDTPKMKEIREAYRGYVAQMLGLLGEKPAAAAAKADQVMDLETKLARASLDRVASRDPIKTYHRMSRADLKALGKGFDWDRYFAEAGTPSVEALDVKHPPYATTLATLVRETPPAQLHTYLGWTFLRAQVLALPKRFSEATFAFQSKALTGAKEDLPRWKKCVAATDAAIGEALAVPFVQRTFGEDGKRNTKAMVQAIARAFDTNLDGRGWMDAATRDRARYKVQKLYEKIGYPDRWRSYDQLRTDGESFLGNLTRAAAHERARDLRKIGKPLDRTEWRMTPPTVNAYYSSSLNEMVFPAGILQPPMYAREATDAVNFGAIGMVIGHELTHGFDDRGRLFDGDGNMTDWWSPDAGKAFVERAACVKTQYDGYVVVDDLHLNGALTVSENVADLGGLKLAFAAMQSWAKEHPERVMSDARFTPEQQFFLGTGQAWCRNVRPEEMRRRVTVDPHSAARFRVNGPLSNMPQFQAAFGCKAGDPMVRPTRCEVW